VEWTDFVGIVATTGVISIPAASFLAKLLVQHRLTMDLRTYDAELSRQLAAHKAELDSRVNSAKAESEARLRREVEEYLGERGAERAYGAEAKKRLYLAVGPLRFQLLLACSEFAGRIRRISTGDTYEMSMGAYFGRSTAYRLIRIFAICDLIERQIAFADFSVDPAMRSLLHFKRRAVSSMSSGEVSLGHPREDWSKQTEHIFHGVLSVLGGSLIVQDAGAQARVMRFDEFVASLSDAMFSLRLEPVPRLITNFSVELRPLLWLRLLALAQLCNALLASQGESLGIASEQIELEKAIALTSDEQILRSAAAYRDAIQQFARVE
jgi:hypothetical protein